MASRRLVWIVILLAFAVMAATGPYKMLRESSADAAPAAESDERPLVSMAGLAFSPSELTVDRGTEVLFDNNDVAPHTVTADDGSVDSGTLNPGKAFRLSIDTPIEYHCEIHPSMTGRILVTG
jgi:plastocyanin